MDASAALTYLLGQAGCGRAGAELDAREDVLVPWLFWSEVINGLARRHGWPGARVLSAVYDLEQLGLRTEPASRQSRLAVIDAIEVHGLTAYDAEYLVLAESADADLMTGDAQLAAAARDRAIHIGADHRLTEALAPYETDRRLGEPDWPRWAGAAQYLEELRREADADVEAIEP
jgi:predicted nucleic acid-binding protein